MAYTSVELPKYARERYIRVVAIDIVISEGIKNIWIKGCMMDMIKRLVPPRLVQKTEAYMIEHF